MRDALIGRKVRINKGPHRGYMGNVQQATDSHVRVELDANNRVVMVRREFVAADGGEGRARGMPAARLPPMTPMHISAGARTPHYTPAHDPTDLPEPGTVPGTLPTGTPYQAGAHPPTPGTAPYTPGTNPAALDSYLGYTGAPTPGSLPATAVAATPAGTVYGTPGTANGAAPGTVPAATPGTAAFGRVGPLTAATPTSAPEPSAAVAAGAYVHFVGAQVLVGAEKGVVLSYDAASGELCVAHGPEDAAGVIDTAAPAARQQLVAAESVKLTDVAKNDAVRVVQGQVGAKVAPGERGWIVGHDSEDGIVEVEGGNFVILPRGMLAKLNEPRRPV